MKVNVEKRPDATSTVSVELPPEEVAKEWDAIADNFARFAKIPGYRPGKAPRAVVEKRFHKEIREEVTKKLLSKGYRDAIEQKGLRVISLTHLEDVELAQDKSMRFRATVVTAPEFDLPEYKNIPVQLPSAEVKSADVDLALERLRDQSAEFVDAPARELEMNDFAVIDFDGAIDGRPISEVAPGASKSLHGGKKFWLHVAPSNFFPGFCQQIVGMKRGDTRSIQVEFPSDFLVPELAGKKADYAVTLNEIKSKVLPAIDDAFAAKLMPGKQLSELREVIEHDLKHEKESEIERAKESQIIKFLQDHTTIDLPPPLLKNETRRALNELVHRNRERGVPDEILKGKEKELVEGAGSLAAQRLKSNFILTRIAEREKIEVTKEEINLRVRQEAKRYNISTEKMRKELEQHDGLDNLAEQILLGKVLDFLKANVSIEPPAEGMVSPKN